MTRPNFDFFLSIIKKCADHTVSDKKKFPTFVRTYPTETQVRMTNIDDIASNEVIIVKKKVGENRSDENSLYILFCS